MLLSILFYSIFFFSTYFSFFFLIFFSLFMVLDSVFGILVFVGSSRNSSIFNSSFSIL